MSTPRCVQNNGFLQLYDVVVKSANQTKKFVVFPIDDMTAIHAVETHAYPWLIFVTKWDQYDMKFRDENEKVIVFKEAMTAWENWRKPPVANVLS